MNWKQHLFKPKWQHKNADIRLESVSTEQNPELISSLVEIAATDEDKRIRCVAIRRLHQLENILKLYYSETDQSVKTLLEERIRQLASSSNESRPALALRMQVIEITSDRDLIEHLANHAPEAELRLAALAKVDRQGVLGDCSISDSDAENRSFAASRISQQTTLKRVIDALRKSDKQLHAKLRNRLHEELLDQGDPKAVQAEAIKICSALEKLALDTDETDPPEAKALYTAWQRVATNASPDMTGRYQRVCDRLAAPPPVISVPEPAATVASVTAIATEPVNVPGQEIEKPVQANQLLAQLATEICLYAAENTGKPSTGRVNRLKNQLEKTWALCTPPHADDLVCWNEANTTLHEMESMLELQSQQSEEQLRQGQELLTKMETELEQGELHKALETRAVLLEITKEHKKNRGWQQINTKMAAMQVRLRELRDWQHWSNNKVRKRLIAEMEVLPAADLHPDALLDRIKSLQMEWKSLEQSEQIPGDKKLVVAAWMWRKFNAAGNHAFDMAKPYLDKRSEIQARHAQSLAIFCVELDQLAQAEPTDWVALGKGITSGRKKLHDLNSLPINQRQKFARKLKAALDKANAVVQEHYEAIEREKMKLIRAASQLIHMPERSEAIALAKSLQSTWKDIGRLWRSKEQELWNQFREHIDPLFNELKEQQDNIRLADDERLTAQKALCTELGDILKTRDDLSALHGKVQGLQDSWKDIEHPDRQLLQSFQTMVESYQQKLEQAQLQQVESDRERWWLKSTLLHELTVKGRTVKGSISKKAVTAVTKAWPEDSSDDMLEKIMDQTLQEILAGKPILTEDEVVHMRTQAHMLCIGLEFVAGLPSPIEDREERMKYQVDRLAESMSGERTRLPAMDEARNTEKIWLGMYALPESDFKLFGSRIKQALTTIMKT